VTCARQLRCALVLVALLAAMCSTAYAATQQPYTQAAFAAAQANNKRILVDVEAPWCSTCAIQRPIISRLDKQPTLSDLVVFTVDFDHDAAALRAFRVSVQSTLILFHGKTEIARLTGETDSHAIDAFLEQAPSRFAQARALSLASYVLAMLAGALSILSPCVLPLLPVIIAGAATSHRLGPPVLAAGLAVSFVTIGLFVATIGFSIGIHSSTFRLAAAVLMVVFGLVLLSHSLESRFALLTAPLQTLGGRLMTHTAPSSLAGQFLIGLLLGAVWSPCTGPLLGVAGTLAMQRHRLGQAALIMLLFGIGAAAPLAIIGALSRKTLLRWRARISSLGHAGHLVLGAILLLLGILMLTGLDRSIETALLRVTPDWLTRLTTSI
jgi:cytochrome c-type biogenesis protein